MTTSHIQLSDVQQRIFRYFSLQTFFFSSLGIVFELIIGQQLGAIFGAVGAVLSLSTHLFCKKNQRFLQGCALSIAIYFGFAMPILLWEAVGGSHSAIPLYAISVMAFAALQFSGYQRSIVIGLIAVSYGSQFIAEYLGAIRPIVIEEPSTHSIDFVLHFSLVTFQLATMVSVYIKKYAEAQAEIERVSFRDDLTGVFNRHYMFRVIDRLKDNGQKTLVALIDVDNFKTVNTKLGYQQGDRCLEGLGAVLEKFNTDSSWVTVARYGGDEFAVVFALGLPNTAMDVLEKIQTLGNRYFEESYPDMELRLSIGFGILNFSHVDGSIADIDKALYGSKTSPSPSIVMTPEMESELYKSRSVTP